MANFEGFQIKSFHSVQEINEIAWNSINTHEDIFHSYSFLRALEDAKVENSDNNYLMIYHAGDLCATAVITSFTVNLDIFIQAKKVVNAVRKFYPGWLYIKMLICGIPASLGQKNIVIKESQDPEPILALIADFMNKQAEKHKIKYLVFKEIKEKEVQQFNSLVNLGYFKAFSLPYAYIELKWNIFDQYLNSLRYGYRRQITASLKKIGLQGNFLPLPDNLKTKPYPKILISDHTQCPPEVFHAAYNEVMSRATSKLETFNLAFFTNYFSSHRDQLLFVVLKDDERIYGSAVMIPHKDELTFALFGKPAEKDQFDTYFNIITAIVKHAIEHGFKKINMGQTSYYPKMKMGALLENEYIYLRSRNRFAHWTLKLLRALVFPKTSITPLHVYKHTA